jgi:hypothetical protein
MNSSAGMRMFSILPSSVRLLRPKPWRLHAFGSKRCRRHSTSVLGSVHHVPIDISDSCFRVDLEITSRYFVLQF